MSTTKEIVAEIVAQATILQGLKSAADTAKGTKGTATDTVSRLAIQAVLNGALDTVKQGVKDHGEDAWKAARGAVNGAAQFANEIKARSFILPKRDRASWTIQGAEIKVVTTETLDDLVKDAMADDTPISSFLTAKRADKKERTAQAERVAMADDDALAAWLRAEHKAERMVGEDITSVRGILDAEALGKAVVAGRAMHAEEEKTAALIQSEAERAERVHMVIGDLPGMDTADLAKLADRVGQEQAKRAAPIKKRA